MTKTQHTVNTRGWKVWTVGDLKTAPHGALQLCTKCGGEYSADYQDYTLAERGDATQLMCCNRPVALVTKHTFVQAVR